MITLESVTPTARKEHRCDWCSTTIVPGEKYKRSRHIGDDGPYTWKACLPCDGLLVAVWDWAGAPDEGVGDETFEEWAQDHQDNPGAAAYLARRTVAREAWLKRLDEIDAQEVSDHD